MKDTNNGNAPAMPQSGTEGVGGDLNSSEDWGGSGLTKREHFAGLAMQGILSSKHVMDFAKENEVELMDKAIAIVSVNYADALLEELEK